MPFVPVPNCVQVDIIYNWANQECVNVLHYVKASPWAQSTMEDLAAGIRDIIDAQLMPRFPQTLYLQAIRVTDISSQTGPVIVYTDGMPIQGENVGESMSNNVAFVVTKRTLLRGRSFRGRIYHPALTISDVVENSLIPTAQTVITNAYENMIAIPVEGGLDEAIMVVVSRVSEGNERTEGLATPVNNMTSDPIVDSQRRRLPGRGR